MKLEDQLEKLCGKKEEISDVQKESKVSNQVHQEKSVAMSEKFIKEK